MSSIYSVKNPPKATKQDDDASTIQVDNNAAAGESHSAFGISSSTIIYRAMHTLLAQNNIIPMLEKCFKKEVEIWRALQDIKNRVVL